MSPHATSTAVPSGPQTRSRTAKAGGQVPLTTDEKQTRWNTAVEDVKTDYTRWRLRDVRGRQTWHYLETDEEVRAWPQSVADKWFLGLDTGLPDLPPAKTPMAAVRNALTFFSHLQLEPGNWACEYGGPMFLLPGFIVTWYVTKTPIPEAFKYEIKNYLFARQHPVDGGWGLHIEGDSSVFGTAMNYTALRLLGASAEDARMAKARALLHSFGGATQGPHWAKFWLSVLGVMEWEVVNPVPPELWLLPDWVPFAPWRWWIHMRQVFLPMGFVWSRRWRYEGDALTEELKRELFVQPWERIEWAAERNSISPRDNFHPKSWLLRLLNWVLVAVWMRWLRTAYIKRKGEEWAYWLIERENENTVYAGLGPVNQPMNLLCAYIKEGPASETVERLRERVHDFLWVKSEGMLANGTNGVQSWDTSFLIQVVVDAGLAQEERWQPMLRKALAFLEDQQMRENCRDQEKCYRHPRKGAWGFSTRDQGYTVSDCTSEALKAVLMLQNEVGLERQLEDARLFEAVDIILTMQNRSGGCASYEPTRGGEWLEYLNAAEVFGRIMIEYDYPECTTACVTALERFGRHYPDYRAAERRAFVDRALAYIRRAQRPDGSWYGSWGICFTYAGMFALESLASAGGETYANSDRVRRACDFFVGKQMADGGWGESYRSCETGVWHDHERSQVVQTAWAVIALLEAGYPHREPVRRGVRLIMSRLRPNGEWLQEAIEGVFNKSCMISYPNYKFIFPIKALGMYAKRWGDEEIL